MQRTRTISTKVTPDEEKTLMGRVKLSGLKPGAFYRQVLLGEPQPDALRMYAAEVRCMRSILLELVTRALKGEPLTDHLIAAIVDDADAQKYARAEQSIEQLKKAKGVTA